MARRTDIGARGPGIAQSIERMILELGGTSSHVAAAKVTLPAMAFDALAQSLQRDLGNPNDRPNGVKALSIFGVSFERGDEDHVIRDRAMERNGLCPEAKVARATRATPSRP